MKHPILWLGLAAVAVYLLMRQRQADGAGTVRGQVVLLSEYQAPRTVEQLQATLGPDPIAQGALTTAAGFLQAAVSWV